MMVLTGVAVFPLYYVAQNLDILLFWRVEDQTQSHLSPSNSFGVGLARPNALVQELRLYCQK